MKGVEKVSIIYPVNVIELLDTLGRREYMSLVLLRRHQQCCVYVCQLPVNDNNCVRCCRS